MSLAIQSPSAYKRLHHHPLASAFLAIAWAALLVVSVRGVSGLLGGEVLAKEASGGAEQQAPATDLQRVDVP
jgi:hypothetical protein